MIQATNPAVAEHLKRGCGLLGIRWETMAIRGRHGARRGVSGKRDKLIYWARTNQMAGGLPPPSYPELASAFGGTTHTTVRYAFLRENRKREAEAARQAEEAARKGQAA